jgi:hypothetical protein
MHLCDLHPEALMLFAMQWISFPTSSTIDPNYRVIFCPLNDRINEKWKFSILKFEVHLLLWFYTKLPCYFLHIPL